MAGAGLLDDDPIDMEDHETRIGPGSAEVAIPGGIEACIGNTPLFRIKSLSEATGCEILGKAEVLPMVLWAGQTYSDPRPVSQRSRWKP